MSKEAKEDLYKKGFVPGNTQQSTPPIPTITPEELDQSLQDLVIIISHVYINFHGYVNSLALDFYV